MKDVTAAPGQAPRTNASAGGDRRSPWPTAPAAAGGPAPAGGRPGPRSRAARGRLSAPAPCLATASRPRFEARGLVDLARTDLHLRPSPSGDAGTSRPVPAPATHTVTRPAREAGPKEER